jgi:hypothetical protein
LAPYADQTVREGHNEDMVTIGGNVMGNKSKMVEMNGWIRENDGPWKPAPSNHVFVVDSGKFPLFAMLPGGSITIDLYKFMQIVRRLRRPRTENVKRDNAIKELWNKGKTEGEILQALKRTYPKLTHYAVKSVIRRLRGMGMLKPHPRKKART